jgi:hypothetical protein
MSVIDQIVNDKITSSGDTTHPAPRKERPARPMPQIEAVLAIVSILANYGRHLYKTLEQRAARRSFATIARFFGSVVLDNIMAHICRGLMRAIALETMLKDRAKYGRDLQYLAPRGSREPKVKDPETGETEESAVPEELTPEEVEAAQTAADVKAEARLARRVARNAPLTMATLPRSSAVAADVLRSPVGRTIAAICRDFGISASLCDGIFWNSVGDAIEWYGGSLGSLVLGVHEQAQKFTKDEWKHPELDLAETTRAGVRRVLGFRIGEEPPNDPPDDSFADVEGPEADKAFEVDDAPGVEVAPVATGPP